MEFKTKTIKDFGIITFSGKTLGVAADSKVFEDFLNDLIDKKVKRIILDLTQVHRINSTGLAILITASTLFSNYGGEKVILAGSNDFINGALSVTKLSQFFNYFADVDTAIRSLTK